MPEPEPAQFKECATCAAKTGSPTLCQACLYNRALVNSLQGEIRRLRKAWENFSKRFTNPEDEVQFNRIIRDFLDSERQFLQTDPDLFRVDDPFGGLPTFFEGDEEVEADAYAAGRRMDLVKYKKVK